MKKVLFVTYDYPYPTNTGGKNRAYHMLKYSGPEFKKYLFSFVRPDFKKEYIKKIDDIGVETIGTELRRRTYDLRNLMGFSSGESIFRSLYFSEKVFEELLSVIRNFEIDIIHFESFYTGFYVSDLIKNLGAKQIFGTENIEYRIYREYAKKALPLMKPLFNLQVARIKKEEEEMIKGADICVAVSDSEAEYIRKSGAECEVVRNGVDLENFKFQTPRKEARNILFVGNFSYFPNVDAIKWFYGEVFQGLKTSEVRLTIVGKKVKNLKIEDPRVEKIEFIPDISGAYHGSDIMVSPVRAGGGTNFKILEAMAAGIPVVALPDRLEGLDVMDGKNIIVAKDAKEFKDAIEGLIMDEKLREKISKNARALAEHKYSWKVIGNNLATVWKNL